jgi:DNA-directed RNA polymerase subunit L
MLKFTASSSSPSKYLFSIQAVSSTLKNVLSKLLLKQVGTGHSYCIFHSNIEEILEIRIKAKPDIDLYILKTF